MDSKSKNKIVRIMFIVLGFVCFGLGTVGVILPILPTVPFYLATVFCFAKSSQRLHSWFVGTGLYKKHLESFTKNRSMTLKTKLSIIISVTLVMAFGFIMMQNIPIGRICISIVWVAHIIYFIFRVKTQPGEYSGLSKTEIKRIKEQKAVNEMINLYCRKKHKCKNSLCQQCQQLSEYAQKRSQSCPFMKDKTFCSVCTVHCYSPQMRTKIKEVMRFSGPRMLFYHPIMAIRHLILSISQKKQQKGK
ncbi:MAG: nitrous oxide-stimulated promoter family protein [Oscillospiraceae bacterium]|nr:nitrous oxide-stimulated promoter family protein [Oscillospiraceae bacterium]